MVAAKLTLYISVELCVRAGGARRVQGQVPGAEGAPELPVHRVQDRREGHGDPGGAPRGDQPGIRRLHRQPARRRVPLRNIRPRLHHRRELPEEQDIFLLLVRIPLLIIRCTL
jgi:hypothetical protein